MASTSNSNDKSTPSPQQRPQPPRGDDIFDCIRRFTEHHVASVLHSLIGLPTMLPPSSAWIMDDESQQITTSSPASSCSSDEKTNGPGGSAILAATETLKKEESSPPPSQSTRGRMAECFLLTDPRTSTPTSTLFRPEEEERLAAVWRQMSSLHRDFAAPFFGGGVFGTGMGKGAGMWQDPFLIAPLFWSVGVMGNKKRMDGNRRTEEENVEGRATTRESSTESELDAYNHLAPPTTSSTFLSTSSTASSFLSQQTSEGSKKPRVIATVATTHSYTGPDGVTRTKYVLKKRFADGSEEKVEEDRTIVPGQPSVARIAEK